MSNNPMENMSIFDMADQNSDSLKERYNSLRKKYEHQNNLDILDEFTRLIENKWTVSINMRQRMINSFLISGRYKNVHELKKEGAEELEKYNIQVSVEEGKERHLKSFYKSRMVFDLTFENGKEFKYSALNIGWLGAEKYGEYCIVLKREQVEKYSSLAFIKKDSLKYVDDDFVNIERLGQDIANRECVHFLTTLKHGEDIKSASVDKWSSIVCHSDDYIESITTDDILNTHIDMVRTSRENFNSYYFDLLYKDFVSELSDFEKYRLAAFRNMQELLNKQGIRLKVLDDEN